MEPVLKGMKQELQATGAQTGVWALARKLKAKEGTIICFEL